MTRTLIAAFALTCAVSEAAEYRCPPTYPDQTYPVKNVPNAPLTGADVMFGQRPSRGLPYPDGWVTPDEKAAKDGVDRDYWLPENEPGWLICTYGARKRVKGQFHDGLEWGQHMEYGSGQPWFMTLPSGTTSCLVRIREARGSNPGKSTWNVTATCDR
jgi:hypothetical protein